MIVNDRITDYIQSLETSQGPVLDEIEKRLWISLCLSSERRRQLF